MHGLAITGMALFAIAGAMLLVALITVSWPDEARRYVMAGFVGSVIGFLTCASIAVFAAARDTYRSPDRARE